MLFLLVPGHHLTWQQTLSVSEGNGTYSQFAFRCDSADFEVRVNLSCFSSAGAVIVFRDQLNIFRFVYIL